MLREKRRRNKLLVDSVWTIVVNDAIPWSDGDGGRAADRIVYSVPERLVASFCILGLLEHPEVLKKAQAQIDSVVEHGHLPELEYESSLPYITAIAYETLRWRGVTPFGMFERPLQRTATDPCG